MAEIYNISQLNDGSNFAEWMLIINGWSGGVLFSAFMVGIAFLIFGIMIKSNVEVSDAFMATNFAMFLISGFMWLIQFKNIQALPTAIVVLFGLFTGIAVFFKLVRGWMK